ncbi:Rieske 2Fe-2S domain-containing protein [Haloarchaeobius sp. HME9146]|uniref:Rieske (2Fe-2S) protein n=1 Tax=Haloarchaeobius sp. HME9146 TaxID=2978732 RepID=UPI0021BFE9C4|nr:Rieske 2Fe-2S domain-containing protein [Haloarchaeobius sp. HME9146]MCT9097182.1 Rieske 2Fe-2S domain-containing protein [Haloarchaeobius sp. HME9146]
MGTDTGSDPALEHLRIATLDEIPPNGTLRFEVEASGYRIEAILCRAGETVIAWENSCPHEPDVKLDRGLGALVTNGRIVCHKHGAQFDCDDGFCTRGPCRGEFLAPIGVAVEDGTVYLADDRFDACRPLGLY